MKPPKGLRDAGKALWAAVLADLPGDDWELDERELSILAAACSQADDVAALEAVISKQGPMATGSTGQPVVHPAVSEARQGRLALGRLLGLLALPPGEAGPASTAAGQRGHRAAEARWNPSPKKKARRGAA